MICKVYRLGNVEYQEAWDLQNRLAREIAAGEHPPALLLLEHDPVYTFGRQGKKENLLWDENELAQRGIHLHWSDRGGDVTFHGPGQLVGYPLLPLGKGEISIEPESSTARLPKMDYVGYLRNLETVLIKTLAEMGIAAGQIKGQTGVWVQPNVISRCTKCPPGLYQSPAKIASIGVKVDAKGISRHGFALNVSPDMSYWEGIIACGLENQNKISLEYLLDTPPTMEQTGDMLIKAFAQLFGYHMEPASICL